MKVLEEELPAEAVLEQEIYDVIIIGGGPAGLTAGLYTSRARLKTLIIDRGMPGGQAALTETIENYPGFPEGVHGTDLGTKMFTQATAFGARFAFEDVLQVDLKKELKEIVTNNSKYLARAVILATGAKFRELAVPGEKELTGHGVSYCATCDGAFFKDKEVVVVGGGNTAVEEAVFLTKFAAKVRIIHRRDSLRATKILQERAFANPKIEFIWDSVVTAIKGDGKVTGVTIRNLRTEEITELATDGVFIFVGLRPATDLFADQVKVTPEGFIDAKEDTYTNLPGVFAAGDIRTKPVRQVVTAASDGAVAAIAVEKYLEGLKL